MRRPLLTTTGAAAILGAGVVAPWFGIGHQVLAPDVLSWPVLLGLGLLSGGLGGAVGIHATINPATHERLHRPSVAAGLALSPTAAAVAALLAWVRTDASPVGLATGVVAGAGLVATGVVALRRATAGLYAQRIGEAVEIPLPQTESQRRYRSFRRVAAAVVGVAVLLAGYDWYTSGDWFGLYLAVMAGLAVAPTGERDVAITDAGLRVGLAVRPWSTFASFRFEADALVLERRESVRGPTRFARAGLDETAVHSALSGVLDERPQ